MSQESKDNLVVYGKPGCVQCTFTTRELGKLELPYKYVDVTSTPEAEKEFRSLDLGLTLPVVVAGADKWVGFRVDKLRGLKNAE